MTTSLKRTGGAIAACALLAALAGALLAGPAAGQGSCYPPTPGCGTTTTVRSTTTTVGSTTTTTCVPNGNGNGNGNGGCGNNGNGNGGGGGNNGNGNGGGGGGGGGNRGGNGNAIAVSNETPAPGQPITVSAIPGSFMAGSSGIVTIRSVERQIGTFVAASDGSVSQRVPIPADMESGVHTIFLKGTGPDGNPLVLSREVTITSEATRPATGGSSPLGPLARTGAFIVLPATALGLALVGGGLAMRRGGRRLRSRPQP